VGMDPGCRPERRVTPRQLRVAPHQLRGGPGILEIRSNRDDAGDTCMEGRVENGRPILVEAAVCEMAVTVEHSASEPLPKCALGG